MVETPGQAGAQTSLEGLYRRHARDVFSLAYRAVGSRGEAEDVTQTTFLNAHRALLRGVEPADHRAWLLTIARNVCNSRFRALGRRPREEPLDESLFLPAADDRESLSQVGDALRALLPRQRAALVMQAVEGCSTAEIGARLGLGTSAVDALLFRARAALSDELRAEVVLAQCARTEALVELQLRHELGGDEQAGLRGHLRRCSSCATTARRLRARKRFGSLLALPWDLVQRLAGLFGPSGVGVKVSAVVGALAIGTTVAVESRTDAPSGAAEPRSAAAVATGPEIAPYQGSPLRSALVPRGAPTRAATAQPIPSPARGRRSRQVPAAAGTLAPPVRDDPVGAELPGTAVAAPAARAPVADGRSSAPHATLADARTGSEPVGAGNAGVSAEVSIDAEGASLQVGIDSGLPGHDAHLSADVSSSGVAADAGASAGALGGIDASATASGAEGISASVGVSTPVGQVAATVSVPVPATPMLPVPSLPPLPPIVPPLGD